MTTLQKQVYNMILDGNTINDIEDYFQLEPKQLLRILKSLSNKGYEIEKEFSSDGSIKLFGKSTCEVKPLELKLQSDRLKLLAISDTHYGSNFERADLVDKTMRFATLSGYHIVIHGGDFIEGLNHNDPTKTRYKSAASQAKYALKRYPYDRNITHFMILGNHDKSGLKEEAFNVGKLIESERTDIIPLGYGNGTIKVANDGIGLYHKVREGARLKLTSNKITLIGHTHTCKVEQLENGNLKVYLPALCDICINPYYQTPGFLTLDIEISNNEINNVSIRRMTVGDDIQIAMESSYQFIKK